MSSSSKTIEIVLDEA